MAYCENHQREFSDTDTCSGCLLTKLAEAEATIAGRDREIERKNADLRIMSDDNVRLIKQRDRAEADNVKLREISRRLLTAPSGTFEKRLDDLEDALAQAAPAAPEPEMPRCPWGHAPVMENDGDAGFHVECERQYMNCCSAPISPTENTADDSWRKLMAPDFKPKESPQGAASSGGEVVPVAQTGRAAALATEGTQADQSTAQTVAGSTPAGDTSASSDGKAGITPEPPHTSGGAPIDHAEVRGIDWGSIRQVTARALSGGRHNEVFVSDAITWAIEEYHRQMTGGE